MIKIILNVLLFLSFSICSVGISSCELEIFGNEDKPPKNWNESGKAKGILVEMIEQIAQEINCQLDVKLYPWARSYKYARKGKGGIIGFSKNVERLALFDYSDVMYFDEIVVVVMKGKEFDYRNISDLKNRKVSTVRNASFGEEYENAVRSGELIAVEGGSPVKRLRRLLHTRVDAVLIGPGKQGVYNAINKDNELRENQQRFVILPTPFKRDPNYLGFAKTMNKSALIEQINIAIQKGHANGMFQAIADKYLDQQ